MKSGLGTSVTERQALLDRLAMGWRPDEMRDLAATLLRLADSIEQEWDGSNVKSMFRWPNSLRRIERNAANLASKAKFISGSRKRRLEYLEPEVLGEPAWDMLLDLFMQYAGGAKVSTTSLCIASSVPTSTALRYIGMLEALGYVQRHPSEHDKRVTFISLADKGAYAMGQYLETC